MACTIYYEQNYTLIFTRTCEYWLDRPVTSRGGMYSRLRYLLEKMKSRFWLLPILISLTFVSINLFFITNDFVLALPEFRIEDARFITMRSILSSVSTSTMTVVGVLFSITFVVLQQAASQYSPRIMQNFIQSTITQTTLGFYLGTFCFSILVLFRESLGLLNSRALVVGTFVTLALAFTAIILTIFYIHTIAKSVKSHQLLHQISESSIETASSLTGVFTPGDNKNLAPHISDEHYSVCAINSGYLQQIEWAHISELFSHNQNAQCYILVAPGDFILKGQKILSVSKAPETKDFKKKVLSSFTIGVSRNYSQDYSYGIKQMVDIGLRALSPGINDPHTAIEAINSISSSLNYYGRTDLIYKNQCLKDCKQIIVKTQSLEEILDLSFNEIIVAGKDFYNVLEAILRTLKNLEQTLASSHTTNIIMNKVAEVQLYIDQLTDQQLLKHTKHSHLKG